MEENLMLFTWIWTIYSVLRPRGYTGYYCIEKVFNTIASQDVVRSIFFLTSFSISFDPSYAEGCIMCWKAWH